MQFLVSLGFSFSAPVQVPPFKKIDAVLSQQRIKPAFVFENENGQIAYVQFGRPIPKGYHPHHDSLLTGEEFAAMVDSGFFPLGDFTSEIDARIPLSSLEHDLAHSFVLFHDAEYADTVHAVYAELHNRKTPIGSADQKSGKKSYTRQSDRLFFAMEMMTVLPKENRQRFLDLQLLPPDLDGFRYKQTDVQTVLEYLKTLDPNHVAMKMTKLLSGFPELTTSYGGGSVDLLSPMRTSLQQSHRSYDSTPLELYHILRNPTPHGLRLQSEAYLREQARLLVYLYESSWIQPSVWVKEASKSEIDANSPLFKLLCASGFLTPNHGYFDAHCVLTK